MAKKISTCDFASDGTKVWTSDGQCWLHREDGPAVERPDGGASWYYENLLHRTDGPALTWPDGEKRWFLHGKEYNCLEWMVRAYEMNEK